MAYNAIAHMGIDIYASNGTIAILGQISHRIHKVTPLHQLYIGTFKVLPFDVDHDAPEPLGFMLESTITGEKLLFFTDTYFLRYTFSGLTHIMGECNYSREALIESIESGAIPQALAPRIIKSHMSLEHFLGILQANDLSKLKQVYLLHMSSSNADIEQMKTEVQKVTGAEVYAC